MQRLLGKIMDWSLARGRGRVITREIEGREEPYLARAILFRFPWFGVFLHCFLVSDADGVHDHPWDNATFTLTTGYWEQFADGTRKWRGPGRFVYRRAEQFHRVELLPEAENRAVTWSLFFVGRRRRAWGFLPANNGWRAQGDHSALYEDAPIHEWFELSYANYLVLPRSVLQSAPADMQRQLIEVLRRLRAHFGEFGPERYDVRVRDRHGRYRPDPLADYRHAFWTADMLKQLTWPET